MPVPLQAFYSDCFVLPLPEHHRFPIDKYRLTRERLGAMLPADRILFCVPPAASDEDILRAHSEEYLEQVKAGDLSKVEQRRIGFPWSPEMVERSRRSTGATQQAARQAMLDGVAVNLAGGTHHAFADHGQGYCVFNDVAVAIRTLQHEGLIRKAAVIDCDVHQGNGTASIFKNDPTVFTCSLHGANNLPFTKCDGDLDIPLPDGTEDEAYLKVLAEVLDNEVSWKNIDMVFYLAGADPYEGDRLGKLKLTLQGLRMRDDLVARACLAHRKPLVTAMAGGYAKNIADIVNIHTTTVLTVMQCLGRSDY